jgi:hypothetical protein
MNRRTRLMGLDDWQIICQFLPAGWESAAYDLGALRRARGIPNATVLLRVLLVHLADGCSLKETALRAEQAGWCSVSAVALFKRLRAAEQWLRWLAERLWRRGDDSPMPRGYRVRAVDATTVQEPGNTGTDWRVHYAFDLANLQCDYFELTDARGGESFRRIPVAAGDLLLGDRAYGTPPGIADVVQRGGAVLVRVNQKALPLWDSEGRRFPLRQRLQTLRVQEVREWTAWVHASDQAVRGRLIAVKLSRSAAQLARRRRLRHAQRRQTILSAEAIHLAGYVFVWTNVPRSVHRPEQVLSLYRVRWQIELAFKRMKSTMALGQLPKTTDGSARAWLHGKLFMALLVERLLEAAESFSPGPDPLGSPAKSLAGSPVPLS